MRRIFILIVTLALGQLAIAQNVGINSTGAAPDASAILDVASTSKGLLIPRVALTATNAAGPVTSPLTSLLVYNTATAGTSPNNVVPGYYYWNGAAWVALLSASNTAWSLTGNTGTSAATNFIGTTDAQNVVFKANNTEALRLSDVGVLMTVDAQTDGVNIDAGTGSGNNFGTALNITGDYNNFLEFNIQNISSANRASTDIVATADNGTETSFYIDLGINSSSYFNNATNILNGFNLAYLYANADNFKIGNGTPGKSLVFFTNPTGGTLGTNSANGIERLTILESGNVGISNVAPSEVLDVTGNVRFSGALMPNNTAGTSGQVLVSAGAGSPPTWSTLSGSSWALGGNSVSGVTNFGTTSNFALPFITNNTEKMRILSTGNVGINATAPNSTLEVNGSIGYPIATTSTDLTLDATHYTVIITGGTPIITLPAAAAGNARRIYVIVNRTGTSRTISSYLGFSGTGTTSILANSSVTIQSDGSTWYRIH
jgi:hypothetical protein